MTQKLEEILVIMLNGIENAEFITVDGLMLRVTGHDAEQLSKFSNDVCLYCEDEHSGEEYFFTFEDLLSIKDLIFYKLVPID